MNRKVIIGIVVALLILVAVFYSTNSDAQTPGFSQPKPAAPKPGSNPLQDVAQGLAVANTIAKAVPLVGAALGIGSGAGTAEIVATAASIATPAEVGSGVLAATGSTEAATAATSAATETIASGGTAAEAATAGANVAATIINIAVPALIAAIVVGVIVNAPSFEPIDYGGVDLQQVGFSGGNQKSELSSEGDFTTLFDSQGAITDAPYYTA